MVFVDRGVTELAAAFPLESQTLPLQEFARRLVGYRTPNGAHVGDEVVFPALVTRGLDVLLRRLMELALAGRRMASIFLALVIPAGRCRIGCHKVNGSEVDGLLFFRDL